MMRITIWAVDSCAVVFLCLILMTYNVARAEPSDPVATPLGNTATQNAERSPEAETQVPTVDTEAQTAEQSPESETAPEGETATQPSEQSPGAETISPASESALPAIGKTSVFKALFNNLEMDFTLSAGLRKDDFQWSKAGDSSGSNPNILSELSWSDVDSYQLTLTNRSLYKRHLYFRGDVNYAFIQNGRIQDSDYLDDNRRNEYSRSISDSSGDQIWDVSLAGGYPFFFLEDQLLVAPLFGISYHKQNLRITDGEQLITSPGVHPLGPINGLDSTYRTSWFGPWIGCDLRYRLGDERDGDMRPMEFGLSFELHYADYEAEANWNLRDDLQHPVSFEHEAEGYGVALAGEWLIGLGERWDFVFRTTYQYWLTEDGVDRAKISDGTVERARLNEVSWHNHSMMVGANYHF